MASKQSDPGAPQAPKSKQDLAELVSNLPDEGRRDLIEALAGSTRIEKQDLAELVSHLPDDRRQELVEVLIVSTRTEKTFSGPLPPPEDFEHYNRVLPDAAHRILAMAEKEQQIRADGQAGVLSNDRKRINGATGIGLALIGVAALAIALEQPLIGLPLGLAGTVTALVRHFTAWAEGRRRDKSDD